VLHVSFFIIDELFFSTCKGVPKEAKENRLENLKK